MDVCLWQTYILISSFTCSFHVARTLRDDDVNMHPLSTMGSEMIVATPHPRDIASGTPRNCTPDEYGDFKRTKAAQAKFAPTRQDARPTIVYYVRHAESMSNAGDKMEDPYLSDAGIAQAKRLAMYLVPTAEERSEKGDLMQEKALFDALPLEARSTPHGWKPTGILEDILRTFPFIECQGGIAPRSIKVLVSPLERTAETAMRAFQAILESKERNYIQVNHGSSNKFVKFSRSALDVYVSSAIAEKNPGQGNWPSRGFRPEEGLCWWVPWTKEQEQLVASCVSHRGPISESQRKILEQLMISLATNDGSLCSDIHDSQLLDHVSLLVHPKFKNEAKTCLASYFPRSLEKNKEIREKRAMNYKELRSFWFGKGENLVKFLPVSEKGAPLPLTENCSTVLDIYIDWPISPQASSLEAQLKSVAETQEVINCLSTYLPSQNGSTFEPERKTTCKCPTEYFAGSVAFEKGSDTTDKKGKNYSLVPVYFKNGEPQYVKGQKNTENAKKVAADPVYPKFDRHFKEVMRTVSENGKYPVIVFSHGQLYRTVVEQLLGKEHLPSTNHGEGGKINSIGSVGIAKMVLPAEAPDAEAKSAQPAVSILYEGLYDASVRAPSFQALVVRMSQEPLHLKYKGGTMILSGSEIGPQTKIVAQAILLGAEPRILIGLSASQNNYSGIPEESFTLTEEEYTERVANNFFFVVEAQTKQPKFAKTHRSPENSFSSHARYEALFFLAFWIGSSI